MKTRRRRLVFIVVLLLMAKWIGHMIPGITPAEYWILLVDVLIAVVIVVTEVLWPAGDYFVRRWRLARTFTVSVRDGGRVAVTADRNAAVPVFLSIRVSYTTILSLFHLKFTNHSSDDPVSADIISIEGAQNRTPMLGVSALKDGQGGCNCMIPQQEIYAGQSIDIEVIVRALSEWSGDLVFTSRDENKQVRIVRTPMSSVRTATN